MPLEPLLFAYGGLASAALTNHRIRRDVVLPVTPDIRTAWLVAIALLLLAAWRSVHHFGAAQAPIAFIGMVCAAGLPLVLSLSRWPRAALLAALPALAIAIASVLIPGR